MRNPGTSKLAIVVAALSLLNLEFSSISQAANAQDQQGLFAPPLAATPDQAEGVDPTLVRSRLITINWDMINALDVGPGPQKPSAERGALTLNLFADYVVRAVLDQREARSRTSFSLMGYIEGVPRSQVTLVLENGVMVGNVRVADSYFQIRYVGAGLHVVQQIDESRFPPDGEPIPVYLPAAKTVPDFDIAATDDGSIFDVMVIYTPAARAAAGGTMAMNALINLAIVETNTAYARSGVFPRLRLVHAEEVAYTESGNFSTDLDRLRNPSDGFMDNVHALRNAHGADLVSFIIEGTSLCGIAYLMLAQSNLFEAFAFSVVARICATGNYSFGHELGHNMGLQHDRADAPADGVFPFSHGYVAAPHGFRDIMGVAASCGGCMRIQNFSNPNVTFNGFSTGVPHLSPQSADAAASLNATAFTVANWRAQVGFATSIGIFREGGWALDLNGNSWWDGCGVDSCIGFGGTFGDIPVAGDWTGTGVTSIGIFRGGGWALDLNGNDQWDGCGIDGCFAFGGFPGDMPVVGDWTGTGQTKIGVYRGGGWALDLNGNGQWDGCGVDGCIGFGGFVDDIPVVGDWTGTGVTKIGLYRNGGWVLDLNGNGQWDGCGVDGCFAFGGFVGDVPVVGDWTGTGVTKIGLYRNGGWVLDLNGNGQWDGCGIDGCFAFGGTPGDIPITGNW
jgi:Metallo-peptidase family M12B Reprolysin-like